jgi:hypothetical protein
MLALTAPPALAQEPLVPAPDPGPAPSDAQPTARAEPGVQRLSDEWKLSRWAYVDQAVNARRSPTARSRVVKRLSTWTGDGTPELVLALSQRRLANGRIWVKVRLPMRPNNRTGWVPRRALSRYQTVRTALRINRRTFHARLFRSGRLVWSSRIGVGQRQWPTPKGRFYIRNRLVPRNKGGIYGILAFGLSATSNVLSDWPGGGWIGIHGTNQPGLIPGRISHGCIRVPNRRIARLDRLMSVGTPVRIG